MNWDGIKAGFVDELTKISAFSMKGLSPETVMEKSQPPPPMETPGFDKARNILSMASQTKTAAAKRKQEVRQAQSALPQQPGIGKLMTAGDSSAPEQAKSVAGYGLAGLGTGGAIHKAYSSMGGVHDAMRNPVHSAASRFAAEAKTNAIGRNLMLGGAAAGAAYGGYRAIKKHRMAKQAMSPDAKTLAVIGSTGLLAGGLGHQAGLRKGRKEADEVLEKAQSHGPDPKHWPLAKKGTIIKTASMTSPAMQLKASKQVGKAKVTPSSAGPSTTTQIRGQLIGKKGVP